MTIHSQQSTFTDQTSPPGGPELLHLATMLKQIEALDCTVAAYRSAHEDARNALMQLFINGAPAAEIIAWQSEVTDRLVAHLWARIIPAAAQSRLALIAVGGYGRAELHPHSDVDILILTENDYTEADTEIGQFVTALWDLGLDIGHSVRDIARCLQEANADITVITNLIESRLITGQAQLFTALHALITPDQLWSVSEFYHAKQKEQAIRHVKFHGSAFRLEPNLKESPGGLRDIQTIAWLLIRYYGNADLNHLVNDGYLTTEELQELSDGRDYLWRLRFLLHIKSGRKEDRLLFDYQRDLAADFGHKQPDGNDAVEQFMQNYYRTVTKIERLNEILLQLLKSTLVDNNKQPSVIEISKRFYIVNGYLEAANDQIFVNYPPAILEIFQAFASSNKIRGIGAKTLRLLRNHLYLVDQRFRSELINRNLFLQLFQKPQKITRKLRMMNRYGVLAKYLPDFEKIVGRMQYDLFHIYTVDEHTLMVIRNLRRFAIPRHDEEYPHCSALMQKIEKPELLYLIGLFHDIAKGRDGDHSILGAEDAQIFCEQHGLNPVDTNLVVWTVRHHLEMSTTAQRKDTSDPEIIYEFARFTGSLLYLDFLYLLTVADIRATNPELWNSWKANLLLQLYERTAQALKRGLDNPIDKQEIVQIKQLRARQALQATEVDPELVTAIWQDCPGSYFLQYTTDEICWHAQNIAIANANKPLVLLRRETDRGSTEIFIYVDDYDRAFGEIVSALDHLSLTIVSAHILSSRTGRTLDTFFVLDRDGETIQDNARLEHIHSTLIQVLSSPDNQTSPTTMTAPRRLKHFDFSPIIEFDNTVSSEYTSLFIKAIDQPGLLSAIGYCFSEHNIHLASANITTLGETAEDAFYIQNTEHRKITDVKLLDALHASLLKHLPK